MVYSGLVGGALAATSSEGPSLPALAVVSCSGAGGASRSEAGQFQPVQHPVNIGFQDFTTTGGGGGLVPKTEEVPRRCY